MRSRGFQNVLLVIVFGAIIAGLTFARQWLAPITPSLKKIFLVHGEPPAQQALAKLIEERYHVPVAIPARGESFELGR